MPRRTTTTPPPPAVPDLSPEDLADAVEDFELSEETL